MRFHIGIRVDKIVSIGPSHDSKFPTHYLLDNGSTTLTTGKWQDNAAKVERLLQESTPVDRMAMEVSDLRMEIGELRKELKRERLGRQVKS